MSPDRRTQPLDRGSGDCGADTDRGTRDAASAETANA